MGKFRHLIPLATLLMLAQRGLTGCNATQYHERRGERDGGYQDKRIDATTFSVKFLANHSSDSNTRSMLLVRCAVIASANGYAYFNVITLEGGDNEMTAVIKLTNEKTRYPSAKTVCAESPENVWFVCSEAKKKP